MAATPENDIREWWRTAIIDIEPDHIRIRGYPIQDLIGSVSFPQMIWLMTRGELPTSDQARLLEAALVASVDHGPHAPSISIARMAMTCGVGLNNAIGSAVNVLGDIHGGAGQECMEVYGAIAKAATEIEPVDAAADAVLSALTGQAKRVVPGFGHRFHKTDPRAVRLYELLTEARRQGVIDGRFMVIGKAVEAWLTRRKGKSLPMNIDGVTAVVFAELGFPPALGRGLFILSRAVGVLAHAFEQSQQGARIKGPMPPSIPYTYDGPALRRYERAAQ